MAETEANAETDNVRLAGKSNSIREEAQRETQKSPTTDDERQQATGEKSIEVKKEGESGKREADRKRGSTALSPCADGVHEAARKAQRQTEAETEEIEKEMEAAGTAGQDTLSVTEAGQEEGRDTGDQQGHCPEQEAENDGGMGRELTCYSHTEEPVCEPSQERQAETPTLTAQMRDGYEEDEENDKKNEEDEEGVEESEETEEDDDLEGGLCCCLEYADVHTARSVMRYDRTVCVLNEITFHSMPLSWELAGLTCSCCLKKC